MAEVIRMPRLSDTMEEGNILGWSKKVGDKVEPGDVLAEVETDKATMELESYHEGVLLHIGVDSGSVPVNGVLAVIGKEGEDYEAALKADAADNPTPVVVNHNPTDHAGMGSMDTPAAEPAVSPLVAEQQVVTPTPVFEAPAVNTGNGRVIASPLAKSIAKDAGVDISRIPGTGDGGRIIKKDVEAYIQQGGSAATQNVSIPIESDFQYGDVPTTQIRKVIAKRLSESKFTAPHFYLTMEIDMENMIAARKGINEGREKRISYNDIIVKVCAMALRKHPAINSSWFGDKITYHQNINIGVAVAIEDGLVVPVVKNTDLKSLSQINAEVKDLAGKGRNRKLTPDQMSGNTFTISNLGSFPIDEFTAIINPPDACIMAVGTIVEKPVVKNGQIVVGNTMKVTLSCDHRVVDGAKGSEFLVTFKNMMEQPLSILL